MGNIIEIKDLKKTYKGGHEALKGVTLSIRSGEIFALLGPNGAGKTTLIDMICGSVTITTGTVTVGGYDVVKDYKKARSLIGLVPQEIALNPFITVVRAVEIARGLYGKPKDDVLTEKTLKMLSLWDKKDSLIQQLSGGMKRRVLIAKALMNEPKVLFLDEPTAGVDVDLRRDLWESVRVLKENGTTIVLTTHYLEEAESMADRVGIINKGELTLVEEKSSLMKRLGGKKLILHLESTPKEVPQALKDFHVMLDHEKNTLEYEYNPEGKSEITALLNSVKETGIIFHDMETEEQSLEDIFVALVKK
jgi:ABC-2 type transport system ATP-binding protein